MTERSLVPAVLPAAPDDAAHDPERRRLLRVSSLAVAAPLAAPLAATFGGAYAGSAIAQQAWPAKPIHIIVPFTPGGSTDILARAIGQRLSEAWNVSVVIDNRPGAGGSIGADVVARAAPDGYTLLMGHIGTLAVNASLYPNLSYDPIKSFVPVAWVARVANVLVVHPSVAAKNVAELVALAKAKPGMLHYGSGGNGSAAHIAVEYFKQRTGTDIVHIPYKGTAPAVTDLLGGRIEMTMTGAPVVMPHIKAGTLRGIAVSTKTRLESLPDLPTIAASGYPDFEAIQWYGVVAPAGTPPAVVKTLNAEVNKALSTPLLKSKLESEGAEGMPTTPEVFGQLIATEIERWRPVIKAANLKPD